MPGTLLRPSVTVVLAAYAAGAAWLWLEPGRGQPAELIGGPLIAFVLPSAAAVVLWLFHAIESRRPVCVHEPGDCAAIERIIFRCLVFIAGLQGLVMLQLTEAPGIRTWGQPLLFVLVGTLLVSVGNLLPTTRPNVLVGIRTPRSLRSRPFWIEINRIGGYVTVALGLVIIVSAVALHYPLARQVTIAAVFAAVAILVARYRRLVWEFERP